jgi:hypothetical protein
MKYLGLPLSIKRLKRIHFQPLEDKVATKLVPWIGKHVTMAGRSSLVKSVLTSIIIYYITVLAGAWLMAAEASLCVVNDQPVGNPKRKV